MHRIDADGNIGNQFTNGNPGIGLKGTVVDAPWLNDVQEEICAPIEAAGLTLVKGTQNQLLAAIRYFIAHSDGVAKMRAFITSGPVPTVHGSKNLASVTLVGNYLQLNFSTPMLNTNYSALVQPANVDNGAAYRAYWVTGSKLTTSIQIGVSAGGILVNLGANALDLDIVIFGDQ